MTHLPSNLFRYAIIHLILLFILPSCSENETNAQTNTVAAFPNLSFDSPTDIQQPGDGTDRLFVLEQPGRINVFPNNSDVQSADLFLDIEDQVLYGGEQGLLGLAFHPDYESNGYFYINYTTDNPRRTVVSRWNVNPTNPDQADPNSEFVILEVEQPFSNHNGGQIQFGPDGYLYVSFGDGGSGGDPQGNGQNRGTLLGSIIRIDVNGTQGNLNYAIPNDNPYAGNSEGYREEIWAYGLRNVWRFSFDSQGRLWAADVGQNQWEEVDLIEPGKNYGWNIMEGMHCYSPSSGCDQTGLELPLVEYGHTQSGGFSITGGYVYTGTSAEELLGKYIYADFVTGNIWALSYNGSVESNDLIEDSDHAVSTFGVDANGELYFASFNDGMLYKFEGEPVTGVGDAAPINYRLDQNFPNPFNPETQISFSLKQREYARVEVFDALGRKIEILYDGIAKAGSNFLTWNAGNQSSGVYFYKLTTDDFSSVKKMALLK